MVKKEFYFIEALDFDVRDDGIICYTEGDSVLNKDCYSPTYFTIRFTVCENSVINWYISHNNWTNKFLHEYKVPEFQIYNIKKDEIKNNFDLKQEQFRLNFYTNEKGDSFFLSLELSDDKKDFKDITNMKIGDEMEFKLQGDIFILSFTVKLLS
jgi:hypothetical protein